MRLYEELSFEYFLGKHSTAQILTSLSIEFPLLFLPFFFFFKTSLQKVDMNSNWSKAWLSIFIKSYSYSWDLRALFEKKKQELQFLHDN